MKHKLYRALSLLLAALLLSLPLASCGVFEEGLSALVTRATESYFSTSSPSSTSGESADEAAFRAFLDLVNYDKVEETEKVFRTYYIGEFREIEVCLPEVFDHILANYYYDRVTETEIATTVFINSYLAVLGDRYAYYYDPSSYGDYTEDISGEYSGIGVSVTLNAEGYADILTVFASSPAEEAGLLPGDLIVAVEGVDFAEIGYQEAINRVRGEVGTTVTLTIERDGVRRDYTVTRRKVTEETVDHKMLDGDIGYIRITSFDDRTYEQFVEAYEALAAGGAEAYVFDVRNNPGGTLTSVVAILEYILPNGDIVHMNYKDPRYDKTVTTIYDVSRVYMDGVDRVYYENHAITAPLTVLANGNTASAGELFTSSLMDYGVATVIGEVTYGKGVGQSSFYVDNDGSAVTVTIFRYDPPVSPNYDGVGITPDLAVSLSEEASRKNIYKLTLDEDAQLRAAIAHLTSANAQ
ncbi:MAG: PDZ domain-containing protein [Clostridia bacterium]|nr:PDZ domain-containing protein [Clostridia bacterium]